MKAVKLTLGPVAPAAPASPGTPLKDKSTRSQEKDQGFFSKKITNFHRVWQKLLLGGLPKGKKQ